MTKRMKKWWELNRWWLHLVTFGLTCAISAGVFVQTVYAYGPRIDAMEKQQETTQSKQALQDLRLVRIEQGVDDIKFYWGIPKRGR